jgi:hypothetical protein
LTLVRQNYTGGNGYPVTTGTEWKVNLVADPVPITLFRADPKEQQPAASLKLPGFQDPSTNCHGYTFGCTDVVGPDGAVMNFQLVQAGDVNTVLTAAYTSVSLTQAMAAVNAGKKVYFVFYDDNGDPAHSALLSPGQKMITASPSWIQRRRWNKPCLDGGTQVSSKNGDNTMNPSTTIGALMRLYGKNIKMFIQN